MQRIARAAVTALALSMAFATVAGASVYPGPGVAGVSVQCSSSAYSCVGGGYSGSEPWGYYTSYGSRDGQGRLHNCTSYAAFRAAQNGASKPGWHDNANGWDEKARAAGTPVDGTASVGAIAQWNSGYYGHVAYVEAVDASGITITDDNYGANVARRVRIDRGSPAWPDTFIHIKDVVGGGGPSGPPPVADADADAVPDTTDVCTSIPGADVFEGCPADLAMPPPRTRTDFDGDGRADYCRLVGGQNFVVSYATCTLSAGTGFGATVTSGVIDYGYPAGRSWVDFNGDGRSDYCRLVGGANFESSHAQCTLSTGGGFGTTLTSDVIDYGYAFGRAWVDFDGDGKADYCRLVGGQNNVLSYVQCTLSTGDGFGATITSGVVDYGYTFGRDWVDFNGDGKVDYCRLVGADNFVASYAQCTLSTGSGFGATVTSGVIDYGYTLGRAWVDFDGDGDADYCRRVGGQNNVLSYVQCTLSTGDGFGATITSGVVDYGYDAGRQWADVNGDGKADYCRLVGLDNFVASYAQCTLSTGTGFGATVTSGVIDYGYPVARAWVDFDGDGKADYCRRVGGQNNVASHVQCTLSTGDGFGAMISSGVVDWGYDDGAAWAGSAIAPRRSPAPGAGAPAGASGAGQIPAPGKALEKTPAKASAQGIKTTTPKRVRCVVPRLAGKSLSGAKRSLVKARCRLGRVRYSGRARQVRRPWRVGRQSVRAGTRRSVGTRINVTMVRARRS